MRLGSLRAGRAEAARRELDGLRVMELYKRAQSEGVDEATLEAAMDGQSPKADIIQLLLDKQATSSRGEREAERRALREELGGLRVMVLHARATGAGVEAALVDDAMDGADAKATLIEMILEKSFGS